MGIKIHHGPDGTYKTSGAIKDDILPIIKSGRTLVTNVRGFSRDNAVRTLGRKFVHKDFKVIFVDTELNEGREHLARFFHWAPKGAFFVIDEVQRIFKPAWREKDLALLSYQGGPQQAAIDDRPEDIHTAWDMQRHHNWDFVFTTTSITKVRSEMRDMAKVAIRHYNLGVWRFYKTVEHGADSRGTSGSSQGTVKLFNYVPKKIFSLYSSTKTGTFENTEPRTAFYKDPKIGGLLVCLGLFWGYILSKPTPKALGGDTSSSAQEVKNLIDKDKTDISIPNQKSVPQASNLTDKHVGRVKPDKVDVLDLPFLDNIVITGSVFSTGPDKMYSFEARSFTKTYRFTTLDLTDIGVKVRWIKPCKASVTYKNTDKYVYCDFESRFNTVQPEAPFNNNQQT